MSAWFHQRGRFGLFVFGSVVGAGLMFWSAVDWFDLMSGARVNASFCTLSSYWNCDRAGLSPAGSFAGVPVGVLGSFWFLAVGFLGLAGSSFQWLRRLMLMTGLLVAIAMASYLFLVLKTGCITCVATYVLILLVLVTGWKNLSAMIQPRSAVFAVICAALCWSGYASWRVSRVDGNIPVGEIPQFWKSLPVKTIEGLSPLVYGPEDAKVQVLEFSDFACPYCAIAAEVMVSFLKAQKDVRIVFFPFPFDSQCNRAVSRSVHPGVCDWSKLALCAQQQEKFWPIHDWIFAKTRAGERLPSVEDSWDHLDLDVERAKACLASAETEAELKRLVDVALNLEVKSTPTFIINGRPIAGFLPIPVLRHILVEARQ